MRLSDLFILVAGILFLGTAATLLAYFRRSWTDVVIVGGILTLIAGLLNRWFAPWPAFALGVLMIAIGVATFWSRLRRQPG